MTYKPITKEEKKKISKPFGIFILFGSLVISITASLLLGHVLETIFRIFFNLTSLSWMDLIVPGILLFIFMMVGTAALASAFWISSRWIQVGIFIGNLVLPLIIEVVDIYIRGVHVYEDFMSMYSFLF